MHLTDLSGRETMVRITGGMKVKADRDKSSPYVSTYPLSISIDYIFTKHGLEIVHLENFAVPS